MSRSATLRALILALVAFAVVPASASALPGARVSSNKLVKHVEYPDTQHLHYEYGPIQILPGQNNIEAGLNRNKPTVPGYITRFKPNLVYSGSHKIPRVDVIHLHHGVWLNNLYPTFAAGEEKTVPQFPRGYGYHYKPSDRWIMNYMIHNLTPNPTKVSITYDIDFVPDSSATAAKLTETHPLWMDVSGIKAYPVFDAIKGTGRRGKFTFPGQATASQKDDVGQAHQYVAARDMTLVSTAGHLHPGGLYTDLKQTRGGRTKNLFRSVAKYFEPAGAVSWDVSMTATEAELARGRQGGRPPQRVGYLRHPQGVLVRVDGDHGPLVRRRETTGREGSIRLEGRLAWAPDARASALRTEGTEASRAPGSRTPAIWRTACSAATCRSRASATSAATCSLRGRSACPRW